VKLYPTDFYAPGTTGALKALYKTISGYPELTHYAVQLEAFVKDVCEGMHSRQDDPAWEWALQETDPAILENDRNDENETISIIEELELDIDSALGPDPIVELNPISSSSVYASLCTPHEDESSTNTLSVYERKRTNSISSALSSTSTTPIASVFSQSAAAAPSIFNGTNSMHSQEPLQRKLSSTSPTLSSINEHEYVPLPIASSPTTVYNSVTSRSIRSFSTACE
jgi:hypothetical protein